jgi:hypothetical protein
MSTRSIVATSMRTRAGFTQVPPEASKRIHDPATVRGSVFAREDSSFIAFMQVIGIVRDGLELILQES